MRMKAARITAPVASITRESPTVSTFTFAERIDAQPGQFVMLTDYQTGEKPFSLSSVEEGAFSVTLRAVGPFTRRISQLAVGDFVGIRGAFGSSFFVPAGERVLLIGGGCGTPPLYFLARQLVRNRNTVLLLNGARTGADLLLAVTEPTISGRHDLERLHGLTTHFHLPMAVCVNKYDINQEIAAGIEGWCDEHGVPVVGSIPYDAAITAAQIEGISIVERDGSPAAPAVRDLWQRTQELLGVEHAPHRGTSPGDS